VESIKSGILRHITKIALSGKICILDIDCIGPVLSNSHIATFAQHLPLYANMLYLYDSGIENSRAGQRFAAGIAKNFQVSSLGWKWF
jgi:hypothetical protein